MNHHQIKHENTVLVHSESAHTNDGSFEPKHVAEFLILVTIYIVGGTAVAQWLRCCATNRKGRWFDPRCCHWNFSLT